MSSNWQNKLFHYKEDPPSKAWDAITAGLDTEKETYPDKLYNFQQTPPPALWQKIEDALPAAAPTGKVVAMPLYGKLVRYAAAAVVILAVAAIAYFAAPDAAQTVAGTNNNVAAPASTPSTTKKEKKYFNVPPPVSATVASATPNENNRTYAAIQNVKRKVRQKLSQVNLPIEPAFASTLAVAPTQKSIVDTEHTDRYMIATTDDGNPVRLPKKVYSAFACPDDEPARNACELQLTLLQQKMSASLTTDFAQFLDLLKNLQENSR